MSWRLAHNRRSERRVDFLSRVRVVPRHRPECIDLRALNISRDGMFLCARQPLEPGSRISLEIETPRQGPLWVRDGEVVWARSQAHDNLPRGMGIRFQRMSPKSRERFELLMGSVLGNLEGRRTDVATDPRQPRKEWSSEYEACAQAELPRRSRHLGYLFLAVLFVVINLGAYLIASRGRGAGEPALLRPTRALARVGRPAFRRSHGAWRMVLETSSPARVTHFKLRNPPRLVVDVHDAVYTGSRRTFRAAPPGIRRVRVGSHADRIRYVLEFTGRSVPGVKVRKRNSRVVVSFPRS